MEYLIKNINVIINFKNRPDEDQGISYRSLKGSIKKQKLDIDYSNVEIPSRICTMCRTVLTHNDYRFKFEHITENQYNLVFYKHLNDKEYAKWHVCKSCHITLTSMKLNPNSVKFINLAYNIQHDDCLSFIHSRNKSKFYRCNHKDEASYKEHQSHSDRSDERSKEIIKKYTDTYYKNKADYIKTNGIDKWNEKQKYKDTMSLEYHKRKYKDDYINIYNERVESVISRRPDDLTVKNCLDWISRKPININCVDDFYKKLYSSISHKGIVSKKFYIDKLFNMSTDTSTINKNHKQLWIVYSIIAFGVSLDSIYKYIGIDDEVISISDDLSTMNNRSYNITVDGFFFRSDFEYTIYKILKSNGIRVIDVNKRYPNKNAFYDLKILFNGVEYYIEVCGGYSDSKDPTYTERQYSKHDEFNSILVGYKHLNKFKKDIESGTLNDTLIYY